MTYGSGAEPLLPIRVHHHGRVVLYSHYKY
jgi:hypothetical protein